MSYLADVLQNNTVK